MLQKVKDTEKVIATYNRIRSCFKTLTEESFNNLFPLATVTKIEVAEQQTIDLGTPHGQKEKSIDEMAEELNQFFKAE